MGLKKFLSDCRPGGPVVNSHLPEGVDQELRRMISAEGRAQVLRIDGMEVSALLASKNLGINHFHALTDVAIEYRPFGPEIYGC
jgi:hypothetical protein